MEPLASPNVTLLLALLDLAPEMDAALGEAWPTVRDQLLLLISRAQNDGDTGQLSRDLNRLLDYLLKNAPTTIVSGVRASLRAVTAIPDQQPLRKPKGVHEGGHPPPSAAGAVVLPVFYSTDRGLSGDPVDRYAAVRGDVTYGVARVSVPTDPRLRSVGELSGPRWWRLEFSDDPRKHVALVDTQPLQRSAFIAEARDALLSADQNAALLFIHGYNVTFSDAARRAAQLAVDLKFPGRTLMYSWSSAGHPHKYTVDEATVEWSIPHFEAFLRLALVDIGASSLHVIAHSMGNRALIRSLERFDSTALPSGAARLRQIVFAAPDVDADTFCHVAQALSGYAERFTLYSSSRDLALKASHLVHGYPSHLVHGYPRAGDAGDDLLVINGVDTIDATMVDTSLVGLRHSYFGSTRSILNDIFALLQHGHGPQGRFDLVAASSTRGRYWQYRQ
jgi:esterase/lipase superfamily enzyme